MAISDQTYFTYDLAYFSLCCRSNSMSYVGRQQPIFAVLFNLN